jgi:hypothetical protein
MNLNFEQFFFPEPVSLIISIFLFYGCFATGNFLIEKLKLKNFFLGEKNYRFFSILFFINLIQPILFSSALLGIGFKFFSLIIGIMIIFFALYDLYYFSFKIKNLKFSSIIYLPLIFYFISSLGPVTNADSLDYHSTVATYILNYGQFPDLKIWFHSIQAGAGETIIALSFFLKSEQFGSLIQFSGLVSIFGSLHFLINKTNKKKYLPNILFILIIITCPLFIQLSTSLKPQLFYLGSITFVFTFIFFNKLKINNSNKLTIILILTFLSNAFLSKFSFLLSSFFLFILFFINKINNQKETKELLYSSFFCFLILILPSLIFKNYVYGINFINFFTNPFPTHLSGYDDLYRSIVSDRKEIFSLNINNNLYHWYNIILPTNLTSFTNSIGLGVLLFFYIRVKNKIDVQILLVSILYILIIFLAGQQSGRFIIEPYIWLSILAFSNFQKIDKNYSILYLGSLQPIFVSLILIYSIVYIGNGSLYSKFKVNVLERSANGYSLAKWANSKLKNIEEDVVIYTHRSISLPEFKVIPGDFLYYINLDTKKDFDENKEYFQEILRLSPKYILFYGENFRNEKNNPYKNFFRCSGKLLFSSSNVGKEASRNVFLNKTYRQKYAAYIYEFNIKNFPECLK